MRIVPRSARRRRAGRLLAWGLVCGLGACAGHAPPPRLPGGAAGAAGVAPTRPAADSALPLELRIRTFDVAWSSVQRGFYDPSFGGVNWDSIGAVFRPRALAQRYSGGFHAELARMLATLGVSHTVVLSPHELDIEQARVPGWTGAAVRRLAERWVVVRVVPRSPAARAGLHPGDVVDSISGLSADSIARSGSRTWLRPAETLLATTAAVNEWLAGNRGSRVRVVARDIRGRVRALVMTAAAYPGVSVRIGALPPTRAVIQAGRIREVQYLRFSAFVPALRPEIDRAIRRAGRTAGLIIDLRGNPGGFDALGDHIASLLVRRPVVLTETRMRHGTRIDRADPTDAGYHGPVVVLLDALSASASEQFTAPLQELGRVTVVGQRSAGADLEAAVVNLPTGGVMMYPIGQPRTADGQVIEGRGVVPDLVVPLTRAGLARGHDAQLDAALDELTRRAQLR